MNQEGNASKFPATVVKRLTGQETFRIDNLWLQADVQGFWQWACSDLLSNTLRGQLAEYVVGLTLGCASGVRREWDAVDLRWTPHGSGEPISIEVKSAAYLQSWKQEELSAISFDIAPKKAWDAETNTSNENSGRAAQVYVFALLHHKHKDTVNPLDLAQWSFFALPTKRIDADWTQQKRVSLGPLEKVHGSAFGFTDLPDRILASVSSVPS
jgi:hypothetical protein